MKKISFLFPVLMLLILSSCVTKRKYVDARLHVGELLEDSTSLTRSLSDCNDSTAALHGRINDLNGQMANLQDKMDRYTNLAATELANQQKQLTSSQQTIAEQQKRLETLESVLRQQREAMDKLRQTIADALVKFGSDELSVHIKNGKVYVSMQEKLLFSSGSAVVDQKGKEALAKLAQVLNESPDIDIDVEGHTDSIPIHGKFQDNWALSLARAASIARILINDYKVDPERITASGRSKYDPVDTNSTPEGRAHNRRTEIILAPNLDELYQLINQTPVDSTQ
jgi:chemotaxis protein MotB